MTAYEFTRFDADFTKKVKAQSYQANVVALQIELAHKTVDPRQKAEYSEAKNIFIECTMSCNQKEAAGWMEYWAVNAIAYGLQTKAKDWQYKFLAAYDLWSELVPGPKAMSQQQAKFLQHC